MQQLKEKFEETEVLSSDYQAAVNLDIKIKVHVATVQKSLYEVCKSLKEMHDGKLYRQLDYANFEEYCENEVGINRKQAHKYISIAKNLPADFVHSSGHFGVTKLALLAMLDEPVREEVTQAVDVESATVKELKATIKTLKDEKKQQKDDYQDKITQLERQVEDLEKRPVETVQSVEELKKIEELEAQNELIYNENEQLNQFNAELQTKLEESRQRERNTLARLNEVVDESADTTEELEQLREEMYKLKSQPEVGQGSLMQIVAAQNEAYTTALLALVQAAHSSMSKLRVFAEEHRGISSLEIDYLRDVIKHLIDMQVNLMSKLNELKGEK